MEIILTRRLRGGEGEPAMGVEVWEALGRAIPRHEPNPTFTFGDLLSVTVIERRDRGALLVSVRPAAGLDVLSALERVGEVPLPPYIQAARRPHRRPPAGACGARRWRRRHRGWPGREPPFPHAGQCVHGRHRSHHQLSPAALVAADAGGGVRRARERAGRLCGGHRARLSFLQLRRRHADHPGAACDVSGGAGVFTVEAQVGQARAGRLRTAHGEIETPVFMPVGTQASVKALSAGDLETLGPQIILGNTYHLALRPGPERVAALGGLHRFMSWPRAILTDSGGFQVFSLRERRTIDDDGVTFRSHLDGSPQRLTPERAMAIQAALGSDIAMAFDECPPAHGPTELIPAAMTRTTRWAARCLAA